MISFANGLFNHSLCCGAYWNVMFMKLFGNPVTGCEMRMAFIDASGNWCQCWCFRPECIKWRWCLCSTAFRCQHDRWGSVYSSQATDQRNPCERDACTVIAEHHFRFRRVTNKWCTFHRHHLRPARSAGAHAYTYAAVCCVRLFPANKWIHFEKGFQ